MPLWSFAAFGSRSRLLVVYRVLFNVMSVCHRHLCRADVNTRERCIKLSVAVTISKRTYNDWEVFQLGLAHIKKAHRKRTEPTTIATKDSWAAKNHPLDGHNREPQRQLWRRLLRQWGHLRQRKSAHRRVPALKLIDGSTDDGSSTRNLDPVGRHSASQSLKPSQWDFPSAERSTIATAARKSTMAKIRTDLNRWTSTICIAILGILRSFGSMPK